MTWQEEKEDAPLSPQQKAPGIMKTLCAGNPQGVYNRLLPNMTAGWGWRFLR